MYRVNVSRLGIIYKVNSGKTDILKRSQRLKL